ncbi:MAG: hypothetical protein KC912_03400 [Proteobacteria bacterium]|nr:hypothetical protein [Pseudomonadota bacterium]
MHIALRSTLAIGMLTLVTAASAKPDPWGKATQGMADVDGRLAVDAPIQVGGLALYPVVDQRASEIDAAFATVGEAMERGALKVDEQDGGTVNQLVVDNYGDEPILALAGDVFFGGNQDRMIAHDVIIPPHSQSVPLAVHCVERGRWEAGGDFAYGGRAELTLSKAVQTAASQDVTWATVSKLNAGKAAYVSSRGGDASKLSPSTETYRASLTALPEAHATARALMLELAKRERVVGVVVAYGGRVVASEIYSHPAQFARHRNGAVAAVALEATSRPLRGESPPPQIAAAFLRDAVHAMEPTERFEGEHTVSVATRAPSGGLIRMASYAR